MRHNQGMKWPTPVWAEGEQTICPLVMLFVFICVVFL